MQFLNINIDEKAEQWFNDKIHKGGKIKNIFENTDPILVIDIFFL